MDKLEFLDGAEAPNEEVVSAEAAPAETVAEEKPERPRGPDGKFAPKEKAEAPVSPAPEPAPTAEPPQEQPMVPLAALHETRDKVRDLEARLAAMQPKQPAPQPALGPAPDMFEDPDAYQAWQQQQIVNATLNLSEEITREKYGDELVDAAKTWATEQFQTRPGFAQEVLSQRNPYGYAVKQYQKQQSLSQLGDDPTEIQAYLAWKQAQQAQPVAASAAATPPPQRPPQSIASAPSAGGLQAQAVGPGVAFDSIIR
jgi:hypothetical protein